MKSPKLTLRCYWLLRLLNKADFCSVVDRGGRIPLQNGATSTKVEFSLGNQELQKDFIYPALNLRITNLGACWIAGPQRSSVLRYCLSTSVY